MHSEGGCPWAAVGRPGVHSELVYPWVHSVGVRTEGMRPGECSVGCPVTGFEGASVTQSVVPPGVLCEGAALAVQGVLCHWAPRPPPCLGWVR